MRLKPTEHEEQVALFEWAGYSGIPMFAIPNGGLRSKATGARLKAEGVRAGIPDIFLPIASAGYHGLFIELKVTGGKVQESQLYWISILKTQGYRVDVCYGQDAARKLIVAYLDDEIKITI